MTARTWAFLGMCSLLVGLTGACNDQTAPPEPAAPKEQTSTMSQMTITSPAFGPGQKIPAKYTGDGANVSPALNWTSLPDKTASLALIVDDPDAPRPQPWVHWVIYDIPPRASLPENVPADPRPAAPAGAVQGANTAGKSGYMGPSPPRGHGTHHYHFKLYALDRKLDAPPGLTKEKLLDAMKGRVLGQAEFVGTYERK